MSNEHTSMQKQAFRQYANRSAIYLQKIAIAILYDAQVFDVNASVATFTNMV